MSFHNSQLFRDKFKENGYHEIRQHCNSLWHGAKWHHAINCNNVGKKWVIKPQPNIYIVLVTRRIFFVYIKHKKVIDNQKLSWCQLCHHWWHHATIDDKVGIMITFDDVTSDDKDGIMITVSSQWVKGLLKQLVSTRIHFLIHFQCQRTCNLFIIIMLENKYGKLSVVTAKFYYCITRPTFNLLLCHNFILIDWTL